jgi:hypothetical protein
MFQGGECRTSLCVYTALLRWIVDILTTFGNNFDLCDRWTEYLCHHCTFCVTECVFTRITQLFKLSFIKYISPSVKCIQKFELTIRMQKQRKMNCLLGNLYRSKWQTNKSECHFSALTMTLLFVLTQHFRFQYIISKQKTGLVHLPHIITTKANYCVCHCISMG